MSTTDLTRVTANLTDQSVGALDQLVAATGRNRTDLINTAVLLLADLWEPLRARQVVIETTEGRERLRVLF